MAVSEVSQIWNDVTLNNDITVEEPRDYREKPRELDSPASHTSSQGAIASNAPTIGSRSDMASHSVVSDKHVNDDVYFVADDTSALVPPPGRGRSRRRTAGTTPRDAHSTNDVGHFDYGTASHERNVPVRDVNDRHWCHEGHDAKMDSRARNQLIVVSVLCTLFMIAEIVGGVLSNSLALVTDATHLASDLASFLISLLAMYLATKVPTERLNLGYYRTEVLGALVSILIIWVVTGILVYMAVHRIVHDSYQIEANQMIIVASIGVAFNIIMGLVLYKKIHLPKSFGHNHSHGGHGHSHDGQNPSHGEHTNQSRLNNLNQPIGRLTAANSNTETYDSIATDNSHSYSINGGIVSSGSAITPDPEVMIRVVPDVSTEHSVDTDQWHEQAKPVKSPTNINIKAAMIHVLGDFIQSIGVLIAAIIIKVKPEYKLADPICTFVFSVLVLVTTVTVLRDITRVLLEARPKDVDYAAIKHDLTLLVGVKSVHSLAIWSLTVNKTAAMVHLAVGDDEDWKCILREATRVLRDKHHVHASTVQVEPYNSEMDECKLCVA